MVAPAPITVEFHGIPRQRAGRDTIAVAAASIAVLARDLPQLELLAADGRLSPHLLLALNGWRFFDQPDQDLRPGERVSSSCPSTAPGYSYS